MKLMRICLILAILACIGAGVGNVLLIKDKVTKLQTDYKSEQDAHQQTRTQLSKTKKELETTTAELTTTKQTLETTTAERDKAVTEAADATKRAEKLSADLKTTKENLDSKSAELSRYTSTGWTPERIIAVDKEVKGMQAKIAGLSGENALLGVELKKTKNELALYKIEDYHVPLPAELKGQVVVSDPKWHFVVLNVGESQGVLKAGEFLVSRQGKLVGMVKVSSVEKNQSVANMLPGWQIGEVFEGDVVIPAYPTS
jgi:galactitol-specific phosphotransferase system IIB component